LEALRTNEEPAQSDEDLGDVAETSERMTYSPVRKRKRHADRCEVMN
jgi:hypothetical protein